MGRTYGTKSGGYKKISGDRSSDAAVWYARGDSRGGSVLVLGKVKLYHGDCDSGRRRSKERILIWGRLSMNDLSNLQSYANLDEEGAYLVLAHKV